MSNFFFKLYLVFQKVCCIVWYGFDKCVKGYFGLEDCGKKLWQQHLHIRFGAAACQDGSPPAHIYHFPPHAGQKLHIQNSINASQFTFYTLHGFGIYKKICVKEQYYEIFSFICRSTFANSVIDIRMSKQISGVIDTVEPMTLRNQIKCW